MREDISYIGIRNVKKFEPGRFLLVPGTTEEFGILQADRNNHFYTIGQSGTGKTTLLRIILGELNPDNGIVEVGENTAFNYVDQSRLLLNDEDMVIDAIGEGNNFIMFGNQHNLQ